MQKGEYRRLDLRPLWGPSCFRGVGPLSGYPTFVAVLRASLDQAWNALRPECQTIENRDAMAAAIVRSATYGERDPVQLSA
jgi:hypothetical protein